MSAAPAVPLWGTFSGTAAARGRPRRDVRAARLRGRPCRPSCGPPSRSSACRPSATCCSSSAGTRLGLEPHWTDGFQERLVWGTPGEVAVDVLDSCVFAPILEELLFRGVLYGTLRLGSGPGRRPSSAPRSSPWRTATGRWASSRSRERGAVGGRLRADAEPPARDAGPRREQRPGDRDRPRDPPLLARPAGAFRVASGPLRASRSQGKMTLVSPPRGGAHPRTGDAHAMTNAPGPSDPPTPPPPPPPPPPPGVPALPARCPGAVLVTSSNAR